MTTNKYDRATKELRAVLAFSHDFAETHSLHYITPEILMLGILEQRDEYTTSTLKALQFPVNEIKTKIIESLPSPAESRTENIALTPRCEQVLAGADEEAKRRGQVYIGIEHLLWSLMDSKSGLPSRLAAKADLTQEKAEPLLRELFPASEANQREEYKYRESTAGLMADWQKLRQTEQGGTPHIPKWFLWTVRVIFSALFLLFLMIAITDAKMSLGMRLYVLGFMGVITLGMWALGVPHKMRQTVRRFRDWDNPAIAGTLCDMLTWSDAVIQRESRAGLTQLLPKMDSVALRQLRATHGSHLCRLLTANHARREPDLVIAVLHAFEQVGTVQDIPYVVELVAMTGSTPPIARVREAAQDCLAYLELMGEQQMQQKTLLRAASFAPSENLLRPSTPQAETQPDELLRPVEAHTTPPLPRENEAALSPDARPERHIEYPFH